MACGRCDGYYCCNCDLVKMKEEVRVKKLEVELLELKIEKIAKERLEQGEKKSSLYKFLDIAKDGG